MGTDRDFSTQHSANLIQCQPCAQHLWTDMDLCPWLPLSRRSRPGSFFLIFFLCLLVPRRQIHRASTQVQGTLSSQCIVSCFWFLSSIASESETLFQKWSLNLSLVHFIGDMRTLMIRGRGQSPPPDIQYFRDWGTFHQQQASFCSMTNCAEGLTTPNPS